jgi:hypothetical protein
MNEIIDELVQLNKDVRTSRSQIARLVSEIRNSNSKSEGSFSNFLNSVRARCTRGSTLMKDFVTQLTGDKTTAEVQIKNTQTRLGQFDKNIASTVKQINILETSISESQKRERKEARDFSNTLFEAEEKLQALRHIQNIVQDELLNTGKGASLLQVKTISEKLQELKAKIEKDSDPMFISVITGLMELTSERNLNDQSVLKKFLSAVSKLAAKLNEWRVKATRDRKNLRKIQKLTRTQKKNVLRSQNLLLVEYRSNKAAALSAIEELNHAVQESNRSLNRKANEIKHWNANCQDQERLGKVFLSGYSEVKRHTEGLVAALLK